MAAPKERERDVVRGSLTGFPPFHGEGERTLGILEREGLRLETILSRGHVSPPGFWYDQDEDEWVAVLQGEGEIEFDGGRRERLHQGDWVLLPAGLRHRVSHTSSDPACLWLALFLSPRG
ncbi:MAG TPA: hypothetical protein DIC53_09875 [Synergistaceae bacterium]|jgi:cupin 2 domain-containing protein|nr:hypothetical protein [Synergistaceae bacterium]